MEDTLEAGRSSKAGRGDITRRTRPEAPEVDERIYLASQWRLMWWGFMHHKVAVVALVVVVALYAMALLAEFVAPYGALTRTRYPLASPQHVRFIDHEGRFHWRPFVYGIERDRDPRTLQFIYVEDYSRVYNIVLFPRGEPYKLWGLLNTRLHLFGAEDEGTVLLLGTDKLGRDVLSRIILGARISLSIGLVGVLINLCVGTLVGSFSGLYGGIADLAIQRVIEVFISLPRIPFWMALSAAIPMTWSPAKRYFAITIVLSLIDWTTTARVVRSKFISTREQDFVLAARLGGAGQWHIIGHHLIPIFMSYLIVKATLQIPQMILGETALSFLGIGLQPPTVSWGVLLKEAQNMQAIAITPWLLAPAAFIFVTVLMYNFLGDGLRDAADPYR
jgi:peptide/nickel transport system permease protein